MAPTTERGADHDAIQKPRRQKLSEIIKKTSGAGQPTVSEHSLAQAQVVGDAESHMASNFKQDLDGIQALVTCTVCDQLLYEPWTLGCGHTYCYSCLCSWFTVHKRKKTCPDCRAAVRHAPANAFLIKQIVETFVARSEGVSGDESEDRPRVRQRQENDIVTKDRASSEGLFRGLFAHTVNDSSLRFDESDGVYRCRDCGHEYEGGPSCQACGVDFAGDETEIRDDFSGLSDLDSSEIDSELGYDHDDFDDMDGDHDGPHPANGSWFPAHLHLNAPGSIHNGYRPASHFRPIEGFFRQQQRQTINLESSDDESVGSLEDFIENDDANGSPANHESSDDSDEGGAISAGRRRNRGRRRVTVRSSPVQSDSDGSDTPSRTVGPGFTHTGGWSPLQEESDDDDASPARITSGTHTDDSDSNTMVAQDSDDSDHSDSEAEPPMSPTTRRSNDLRRIIRGQREASVLSQNSGYSGYGYSALDEESVVDDDGDVQMDNSRSVSRDSSVGSEDSQASIEYLGTGHNIIDIDDEESSDGSVRPPVRRRRHLRRQSMSPGAEARISQLFAQHQANISYGAARERELSPGFEETLADLDPLYRDPSSWRNRSNLPSRGYSPQYNSYRIQPQRYHSPYLATRSLAARFIPSTERTGRTQRSTRGYHL